MVRMLLSSLLWEACGGAGCSDATVVVQPVVFELSTVQPVMV